jgi:hypothetical protein
MDAFMFDIVTTGRSVDDSNVYTRLCSWGVSGTVSVTLCYVADEQGFIQQAHRSRLNGHLLKKRATRVRVHTHTHIS